MRTVAETRAAILDGVAPLPFEAVELRAAHGRVLAADLRARLTQPPFATTSMDGYAVRAADTPALGPLRVIGESAAARGYGGSIRPGETVRIFTGAPLPEGADAVLQQELARIENGAIVPLEAIPPGRFVRVKGLDFIEGSVGLAAGRVMDARALALAAAMNHPVLPARRKPRVAILATGDELVPPGNAPGPGRIVASSLFAIRAVVAEVGGEAVDLGLAGDDPDVLAARIAAARGAEIDVLVTLGGASVGAHDLTRGALQAAGLSLAFWKIAMRPGKPLLFGRLGPMAVLGLPGNPVSAHVCAVLFLAPLLRALLGLAPGPCSAPAVLTRDLPANDAREDYLRVRLETRSDGDLLATPFEVQDSSMQAILAAADGLAIRPPNASAARAGDTIEVIAFGAF